MRVLVIGSGGREHAICCLLKKSPSVEKVFCAPGNVGIAGDAECVDLKEFSELAAFVKENKIDLTVVGPEAPLCDGIVDFFKEEGLTIFGPDQAAARLEGSKDYAKQFMIEFGIPTGKAATFTDAEKAVAYVDAEFSSGVKNIVIKADGLAAGKGVLVAPSAQEAAAFIGDCFAGKFGSAGVKVLVEECIYGEEASILAFTDGKSIVPLVSSQDHKRAYDGDKGPNTGGMGAYSPAPVVTEKVMEKIQSEILERFLTGIQARKLDFRGVIFVGVMIDAEGNPKVLEFNVRFGDPETQAVLLRFDGDFALALKAVAEQKLDPALLKWSSDVTVCVVMASGGYPGSFAKGHEITGIAAAEATGAKVFHAGTALKDGKVVNAGGRVLGVAARGSDISEAIKKAYDAVGKIDWQDCFYRKDIAHRALAREKMD